MQVLIVHITQVHDDVCVKLVVVEGSVILEVVGISLDVNVLKQLIILRSCRISISFYFRWFGLWSLKVLPELLYVFFGVFSIS